MASKSCSSSGGRLALSRGVGARSLCTRQAITRLFGKPQPPEVELARGFDHLLVHSDCEGFYLPADFAEVLMPPGDIGIPGDQVGSAPRLLAECTRIAEALELPDGLDTSSEELWRVTESQGSGEAQWERYAQESYGCVALMEGSRKSLETGAALVFC